MMVLISILVQHGGGAETGASPLVSRPSPAPDPASSLVRESGSLPVAYHSHQKSLMGQGVNIVSG